MKSFKLILAAAFAVVGLSATAQVNFDDPKYAVWGETADERKQNMLDNQFMKEAVDNRNYNLAAKLETFGSIRSCCRMSCNPDRVLSEYFT